MPPRNRQARIHRQTSETDIRLRLNLDGRGKSKIHTGIRFFDHMLELVARHGAFDLDLEARGDLDVDQHHTVEDVGIVLGEAVQKALGSKRGILRAGYFLMPMDESLAAAAIDLSGRPHCICHAKIAARRVGDFQTELLEDFFQGFAQSARANVHLRVALRPLLASPSRSHLQSLRPRSTFRRFPRPAPSPSPTQHQRSAMKITILDYGAGNLPSVERAFERLAIQTERATTPESISSAEAIVLPGVGHVAALIRALDSFNLREPLCEAVRRGTPFLGICLGLQVLFASSEEAPNSPV